MLLSPTKKDLTKRCCRTKFPLRSNFAAERGVMPRTIYREESTKMKIANYVSEIEHAAASLIAAIWSEQLKLQELEEEIRKLKPVVEDNYRRAMDVQRFAEDPDAVMMGVGMYWDNYFGEDKHLYHTDMQRQELANKVASHAFSVASLSAALLQHAKQGISLAHGGTANCPNGRPIGSQNLKIIIWEARNQSLHWEE